MNKNKTIGIVLGIFALVIVTTAASFAFFTYSRVGSTTSTVISGDIEFSYIEGESATLTNAFPVKDSVGAIDEAGEYEFQVKMKSSSENVKVDYNVYLVDNNSGSDKYFTNEQIKFALIKNDVFVANTSATEGLKLSTLDGFNDGVSTGEGLVLEEQEISSNVTDNYKLRIWISDDVNYSNTSNTDDNTDENNDSETSVGKYNGYKYSLKVKVTSSVANTIEINDVEVSGKTVTAELSDPNGLSAYAVTNSTSIPNDSEWIEITSETAKSNVIRTANELITTKKISYTVEGNGTYYLHVKNKLEQTKTKKINVEVTGTLASTYIMNLAKTNTDELRIDEHEATGQQNFATTEYRYWGATPKNYVEFNNEMWRIIGVFDVDDGKGNIEKRVKIIRDESIGLYSWDSSESSINGRYGINEWSQADLKILLNEGDYYNRLNNYSSTGLTSEAKSMIGNAKWYLGAHTTTEVTTSDMYNYERGTANGKQCTSGNYCNDSVERKTSWIGEVGLIYPSDYGYAADMTSCSGTKLSSYSSCKSSDWLFNSATQWTISPYAYSSYAYFVFRVDSTGSLYNYFAYVASGARPVTYLSSDIKIVGGTGESGTGAFKISK